QAEALGMTDLNGGALFNAEFGIRHRGSTVPERSGVALSFCRRHGSIFKRSHLEHTCYVNHPTFATQKMLRLTQVPSRHDRSKSQEQRPTHY
ncbi:hypothetical protein, partial [Pseudomonas fragi]|uniref:hypothetical protein n=2 Tax=Pseudomonas fragi TaxID=296 RepID=UPI001CB7436A